MAKAKAKVKQSVRVGKGDLINELYGDLSEPLSKAGYARVVDGVFDHIVSHVAQGDRVVVSGFGSFATVERSARTGVNPQTGKPLAIKAHTAVKFKPGVAFKDAVA